MGGSRPAISGDANLRITTGLRGFRPRRPRELRYGRWSGSFVGLMLRGLADRYGIKGSAVKYLLKKELPAPLPLPDGVLDQVEGLWVESIRPTYSGHSSPMGFDDRPTRRAKSRAFSAPSTWVRT